MTRFRRLTAHFIMFRFLLPLHYPGLWYPKFLQKLFESFPGITPSLAPTIQPFEENTHGLVIKVSKTFCIPAYPIIIEVPSKFCS